MAEKDNAPTSSNPKCLDKILAKISEASELFYQFIFTYGTMTVIMILSICIFLMEPYSLSGENAAPEIWSIIINSYMPTTITFVGVVLFSDNFFKKHKFRGVLLELLVVSMALAYIAFVSVNDVITETILQKRIIEMIRYINVLLMIPSITLMPGFFNENNSDGKISH